MFQHIVVGSHIHQLTCVRLGFIAHLRELYSGLDLIVFIQIFTWGGAIGRLGNFLCE